MNIDLYSPNTGLKAQASINPLSLQALGGAKWPRLALQVLLRIEDEISNYWAGKIQATSFGLLTGELVIGAETIAYIRPVAINKRRFGNQGHPSDEYISIEIELDARRIEWIEHQRAGKSFEALLRLSLEVQIFGITDVSPNFKSGLVDAVKIFGDIPVTCPDAHWRDKVRCPH